ncbi:MAG TPA: YggT family protein [Armatimonadota bacterium]|jgi:uncharacterized protein YggT (Ycf19 family)
MGLFVYLVLRVFGVVEFLVIVQVILSWVTAYGNPRLRYHPAVQLVDRIVDPMLAPIRNALRPYTRNMPLDFSPLILLFGLQFLGELLQRMAYSY